VLRSICLPPCSGYFLKGVGLLLNQALINYGIAYLMGKEYTPLQVRCAISSRVVRGSAGGGEALQVLCKALQWCARRCRWPANRCCWSNSARGLHDLLASPVVR